MCLASVAFLLAIQMHRCDAFIFNVPLKTVNEKKRAAKHIPSLSSSIAERLVS